MWSSIAALVAMTQLVSSASAATTTSAWGYHEDRPAEPGPSKWGTVDAACDGKRQSPINFVYSGTSVVNLWGTTDVAPLKFTGSCKGYNIKELEDVFKWELAGSNACKVSLELEGGKTYSLLQFHIHTPSEHTIEGYHYSGEIHFVHKEDGGDGLLVTGLLLNAEEQAGEHPWIEKVWASMDKGAAGSSVPVDVGINYVDLLNHLVSRSHLFNYSGSLTTPPCSEIVNWWVINNPLSISVGELTRLIEKYKDLPVTNNGADNRPTQALNDRKVKYY